MNASSRQPGTPTTPSVSVVIPTRNRPTDLARAVHSVLASAWHDYELIVVDQSDSNETHLIVDSISAIDSRVRIIRDSGSGSSRAHNIGIGASRAPLIAFTDDDCEVSRTWLGSMTQALTSDETAGIAFGSVLAAPHEPSEGFIVGYEVKNPLRLTGRLGKLRDGGIGANMAARKTALEKVGGFDLMLGPGAYFPGCNDGDLAYRVLREGYALLHVPESTVIHHGLRRWDRASPRIWNTFLSIGAAYTKFARVGDPVGVLLLLQQMGFAFLNLSARLLAGRSPFGLRRLVALLVGVQRSVELDVDRSTAVYKNWADRADPT